MKGFVMLAAATAALAMTLPEVEAQPAPGHHRPAIHAVRHYPLGQRIRRLPPGSIRVIVNRERYHYRGGVFYRPWPGGYVVVSAPLGARVPAIPATAISFGVGSRHYFYFNATYYLYERERNDYVVVAPPDQTPAEVSAYESPAAGELYVYPASGQSPEQISRDRYECYQWAAAESGYDPAYPDQPAERIPDYNRAMTACLEGRGYTVR